MTFPNPIPRPDRRSAFTLVEIAVCLAVIVFGLVAIIGVLPIGMNVQKDNREETIIGQDAQYFLSAIRHGDHGLDDLTNYLVAITNYVYHFATNGDVDYEVYGYSYSNSTLNGVLTPNQVLLTNGTRIIGLLSTPRYIPTDPPGSFYSNYVFADFRALNGPVGDKFPQRDQDVLDFAFGYRLTPEITPVISLESTSVLALTMRTNLREVRLEFRWPLLPRGQVGNNRRTYRAQMAATLETEGYPDAPNMPPLYFYNPNRLIFVPPPPP